MSALNVIRQCFVTPNQLMREERNALAKTDIIKLKANQNAKVGVFLIIIRMQFFLPNLRN